MHDDEADVLVIGQCLRAAVDGPFFPDWEFSTLFGLEREEVRRIADRWPRWADDTEQRAAVNGAMNNLLHYPHQRWDAWHQFIGPGSSEVAAVHARCRGQGRRATADVDRPV